MERFLNFKFLNNFTYYHPQTTQNYLNFLAKRKPIPQAFVGENKSLTEIPLTAQATFLRYALSTVKTRLELKSR